MSRVDQPSDVGNPLSVQEMAVTWVGRVFELDPEQISGSPRWVLASMANHATVAGYCWLTRSRIAWEAGITVKTVTKATRWLVKHGYIEREWVITETGSVMQARLIFLETGAGR